MCSVGSRAGTHALGESKNRYLVIVMSTFFITISTRKFNPSGLRTELLRLVANGVASRRDDCSTSLIVDSKRVFRFHQSRPLYHWG